MEMNQNRRNISEAFLSGKIKAICGYPGIGKSFLEANNDSFVDGWLSENLYSNKKRGIFNPNFPNNYIKVCSDIVSQGKVILSALSPQAREVFKFLDIPYLVIYPNDNEKKRYFNIYDTRNDVRDWIKLNKAVWDDKIESIRKLKVPDNCFKDEIPTGLTLTDYLVGIGVIDPHISIANETFDAVIVRELRNVSLDFNLKRNSWDIIQARCEAIIKKYFRKEGLENARWDCFADSDCFFTFASPEYVRDYYIKVIKNKWYEKSKVKELS